MGDERVENISRKPASMDAAASGAERLSLKESGAMTIFMGGSLYWGRVKLVLSAVNVGSDFAGLG
jgi:hypothetical protein